MKPFDTTLDQYLDEHPLELVIVKLACKNTWPFEVPHPDYPNLYKSEFFLTYETIENRCANGFFGRVDKNGRAIRGVSRKMVRTAFEHLLTKGIFEDLSEKVTSRDTQQEFNPKKYRFIDNDVFSVNNPALSESENRKLMQISESEARALVDVLTDAASGVLRGIGRVQRAQA